MTIESFKSLRNDYEDEIPDIIVHSGPYKVKKAWWQSLIMDLGEGLRNGSVPLNLTEEVKSLIEYCSSEEFHNKPQISTEDIQRANNLLDDILG